MKKILLPTLFILISSFGYAQNTHDITEVIQSDLSAKQLFVNARQLLATLYTDFNKELDDDIGNNIIAYGKSNLQVSSSEYSHTFDKSFNNNTSMLFRLTINCKDNKYRYIISDIKLKQNKLLTETTRTDYVTAIIFNRMEEYTKEDYQLEHYSYNKMDSIYRRDSLAYYSIKKEYEELTKRKNASKGKEKNRLYKEMANMGNEMLNKEKIFNATRQFHNYSKYYINSMISAIKRGMSIDNDNW